MPSLQWVIGADFPPDLLAIIGINNTASVSWLQNYAGRKGIVYPFVHDGGSTLFDLYQVGSSFRNYPPTYIIIDPEGLVQYRTDNKYRRFDEMRRKIEELL